MTALQRFARRGICGAVAAGCMLLLAAGAAFDSKQFNTNSAPLKLTGVSPAGQDVPVQRQIVFHFNRPVVPVGRMERSADEIPIEITPALACEWRWLNTSALACQLTEQQQLRPATRYAILVRPGIKTESGETIAGPVNHEFITERPRIVGTNFAPWQAPGSPQIVVTFNQDVLPESVAQHLRLVIAGQPSLPVCAEPDPVALQAQVTLREHEQAKNQSESVVGALFDGNQALLFSGHGATRDDLARAAQRTWIIRPKNELAGDTSVVLRVEPGVRSAVGPEPGIEARDVLGFDTFAPFRFNGVRCDLGCDQRKLIEYQKDNHSADSATSVEEAQCNPQGVICLSFSAPFTQVMLAKHLRVAPDLGLGRTDLEPWGQSDGELYQVETDRNWWQAHGENEPHRKGREYVRCLPAQTIKAATRYRIRIDAPDFADQFGRKLPAPFKMAFATSHRTSQLRVEHAVAVLEKDVDTHIPVVVTNLDAINLGYNTWSQRGVKSVSNTRLLVGQAPDIAYHFPIKIRELIPGGVGAMSGRWFPAGDNVCSDPWGYFFWQVTPFAVHAKIGHFNTLVWVTRFADGAPVEGARVKLSRGFDNDNLQFIADAPILASATTDADGLASLPGTVGIDRALEMLNYGDTSMLIQVAKDGDLALLPTNYPFRATAEEANGTQIATNLRPKYGHIHTWGFTPQGVYRAGDVVQYKLYVRDQDNLRFIAAPAKQYSLEVYDPRGTVVHEESFDLSEFGAHSGEFTAPAQGAVGWYRFVLRSATANDTWEPLTVLVSDFTPAPFRVTTRLNGETFGPGDQLRVATRAELHAGGPYANANARVAAVVEPRCLTADDPVAKGFDFGCEVLPESQNIYSVNGQVDAQGLYDAETILAEANAVFGQLVVESAVRDDRGKDVASRAIATYAGRDRFVGLLQKDWLLQSGVAAEVSTVVVDQKGKATAGTAIDVEISLREAQAAQVKGSGNAYVTQYTERLVNVASCQLTAALQPTPCRFTPKKAGSYVIAATIKDTRGRVHTSSVQRYAIGPEYVLWETRPGYTLTMRPDKTEYQVGDTARVLVQNPYPGARAWITVERFGVQKHWSKIFNSSIEVVDIPISADALPGLYVSVVVVSPRVEKPLGENQVDLGKPAFKMGYARLAVRDPAKEIAVTVKPKKGIYKPRDKVKVDLVAHPRVGKKVPVELAVAVLDESVFDLLVKGRKGYDPYQGFYSLDELDLVNFDNLIQLVGRQKFEKKGASPGGDGGGDLAMRSLFKFVSYWNPSIPVDRAGKASIEFEVPDNLTSWRVLAVAVTPDDRMGLGDASFKVNQPIELRPALPNQVTEGDAFEARFTAMNRTPKKQKLQVEVSASGAIQGVDKVLRKSFELEARPYQRQTFALPIKAGSSGEIKFKVRATSPTDSDGMVAQLTVRKLMALEAAATYGTTTAAQISENILVPRDIRTDVGRISIVASPTVITSLEGAFKYLRDYLYICWEQKLTKGVMASHYRNLKAYLPATFEWPGSEALPQQTLDAASSHQAPNGGMSYFIPVDEHVSPYLSAYTAIAFNWLRTSGYRIPETVEDRLHAYLLGLLRSNVFPSYYNEGMGSTVRAVALAALAERGKVTLDDVLRYRTHVREMSLFGKAHYLMALTAVHGPEQVQTEVMELIRSHGNETGGKLVFGESLDFAYQRIHDSSLRTNCAVLSAYLAYEGSGQHGASDVPFKLVLTISQSRKQRDRWENTQENMFCMNALIEYARVYEQQKPELTLSARVDAEPIGQVQFHDVKDAPHDFERPLRADDPGQKRVATLEREGSGRFYYAARLFYSPRVLKQEPINSGVEVAREYSVERNGKWELLASPMRIKTGELVRVDLFVRLPEARNFLVVDDPVPGGLEPVNRDLATASTVDAAKGDFQRGGGSIWFRYQDWHEYGVTRWSFYHQELRHFAARFYSEYLPQGNYHLSYVAQAIAPGTFAVMPLYAEEMYNPDTFGQGVPAVLVVEPTR